MKSTSRRGGVPLLIALCLPAVMMVGSMALSFQSSTARRFISMVWMTYVGLELAESAVAEASHCIKPEEVFDPQVFGTTPEGEDFTHNLVKKMVEDKLDGVPVENREYRSIKKIGGGEVKRMLVAFRFPRREVKVTVPGLAKKLVGNNPGVKLADADDLVVYARPLAFRREYYRQGQHGVWVNWGVVQFRVRVRVDQVGGVAVHELKVDRRFSLKTGVPKGGEYLSVSSINLRTTTGRVES